MTSTQVAECLAWINSSWNNRKPLNEVSARTWGAEIRIYPFERVITVLRVLLREQDWRPSLAQILKPLAPDSQVKSAHAAFETVWKQISERPRKVSELEQRAVDRLGGWHVLGNWPIADRHWHSKAFAEVYDDLAGGVRADGLRAMGAGRQRALGPDLRGAE